MITETFTDFVIVEDFKTSKTYKLSVTDTGETVTLGEPEEYEVTYTKSGEGGEPTAEPAGGGEPEAEPMAAARLSRTRIKSSGVVLGKRKDSKGRPIYKMLLCKAGFTDDPVIEGKLRRHVHEDMITDAVSRGVWDGVRMNYEHPNPETGERQSRKAVGGVLPGTVQLSTAKDGQKAAVGECVILNTSEGKDVQELLDATLELGIPFAGTSVFSEQAALRRETIDGYESDSIMRLETIEAQDVVGDAAFLEAGPLEKVAASKNKPTNGDELTMTEREELEKLRGETAKQKSDLAALQRDKDVKAELAKSGLDEEDQGILEPILLKTDDAAVRGSMIALQRRNMLKSGKRVGLSGGPQDGDGGPDDEPNYSPDVKAELDKNAETFKIKPETLAKVRAKRRGVTA